MSLSPDFSNAETKCNFIKLIKMSAEKNWDTYSALIMAIMDVIMRETDTSLKIFFMMKLMAGMAKNNMRPVVKLKLIDLLFSFATIALENSGISNFIAQQLNHLGNDPDDTDYGLLIQRVLVRKMYESLSYPADPAMVELADSVVFESDAPMDVADEVIAETFRNKFTIKHKCHAI
jgi:hypothetical protein